MQNDSGKGRSMDRRDRLLKERIHDPYMARRKPKEPSICPECGAVFNDGRWQWMAETPEPAGEEYCPACRRIQDNVPAGILTLEGDFFTRHRDEIMHLAKNTVETQNREHPLKRIMDIGDTENSGVVIRFTDTHLPADVGKAVDHAYNGDLEIQYEEEASLIRVHWQR